MPRARIALNAVMLLLMGPPGCARIAHPIAQTANEAKGPWPEVPIVGMPTGDTSIPIELLHDAADALLQRPGAKVCEASTRRPIVGLSTEYCSTVYVAGEPSSMSWRVTEPFAGDHRSCTPRYSVRDADHPPSQVWVVGYVHSHPCAGAPSSDDLSGWPTDAFRPYVAMAEVRLIPGNPAPALYKDTAIEMASALVGERQDGSRVILRYYPTGEVQQWSTAKHEWVRLGRCPPTPGNDHPHPPQCQPASLRLLRE